MRERMSYCVARSPLPSTTRALEGSYASDPGTSDGRMQGRGRNRTKIESALKSLAACWFNIRHLPLSASSRTSRPDYLDSFLEMGSCGPATKSATAAALAHMALSAEPAGQLHITIFVSISVVAKRDEKTRQKRQGQKRGCAAGGKGDCVCI